MDGTDEPLESIEEMAEFYLGQITKIQTHGPYFLIGFSLGGLLMLEIAQRLSQRGEKVDLLAMLDSYPYKRYLPLGQRMRLMARLARRRASDLRRAPMRQVLSGIAHRWKNRLHIFGDHEGPSSRPSTGVLFAEAAERVRDKEELAWTRYRPRSYHGEINFVRAEILSYFPEDPVPVWAHLVDGLEVETVPGDHVGMIATHSANLAAVLTRYLDKAFAGRSN
jgi:thioesterase domain-containing protein